MALSPHAVLATQWGIVLAASLVASITDLRHRRIPNLLTGPLLLAGLIFSGLTAGLPGLGQSAAACLLLALPFVLLFVFAGGGAGDAKMMGAIGAWLGINQGLVVLTCVCLSGVVLALAYAAARHRLPAVLVNIRGTARGLIDPLFGVGKLRDAAEHLPDAQQGLTMPYGLAILAGLTVAALYTAAHLP